MRSCWQRRKNFKRNGWQRETRSKCGGWPENEAFEAQRIAYEAQIVALQREFAQRLYTLQLMVEKLEAERHLDRARRFGASSEKGPSSLSVR